MDFFLHLNFDFCIFNARIMPMITISRLCERRLMQMLDLSPAVLLVGPRQIGKSFLARKVAAGCPSVFYDLEDPDDLDKLADPGKELRSHPGKLIVIDEIQHQPDLFKLLRVIIDEERREGAATGKFLLLGSVSGQLQRQNETLTGRVMEVRVHSVDLLDLVASGYPQGFPVAEQFPPPPPLQFLRSRGGYPQSILAASEHDSWQWRCAYLRNAIHKDTVNARMRVPAQSFIDLLRLIAAKQGSPTAVEVFARELRLDHRTVVAMIAVLEQMMLIFVLPAYAAVHQQLRKRCKYYLCDSGMHSCLSNWGSQSPAGAPGANWEGFVIANLIAVLPDSWHCSYSRQVRRNGGRDNEVDLVIQLPGDPAAIWAVEIKSGADPDSSALHRAAAALKPQRSFLIHGGGSRYRDRNGIQILSLPDMMNEIRAQDAPQPARSLTTASRRQAGMKFRAVIWALDHERPDLDLYRREFVDDFCRSVAGICRQAAGAQDRQARQLWEKSRRELLGWLNAESRRRPGGEEARSWRVHLYRALQSTAGLRTPCPDSPTGCNFAGDFTGLCCHDLLVAVTALLVDNGCHAQVQRIIEHQHLIGGRMLSFCCFWAGSPAEFAGQDRRGQFDDQVAEFATSAAAADQCPLLVAADLLLLVSGMVLNEKREPHAAAAGGWRSDLYWHPWLFESTANLPVLPLFCQCQSREGMEQLLACLGIAAQAGEVAQLKKTIARHLAIDVSEKGRRRPNADYLESICLDNWHDLC